MGSKNETTTPADVEAVYGDLIYCIDQSFSLTRWSSGLSPEILKEPIRLDWQMHDALLGISLVNIRMLDDFLRGKSRFTDDITVKDLKTIGFTGPVKSFLLDDERNTIGKLFVHITANRNAARFRKKPFPLTHYLTSVVSSFNPILEFFRQRFEEDKYRSDRIAESIQSFQELLEAQNELEKNEFFRGQIYSMSGSWIRF